LELVHKFRTGTVRQKHFLVLFGIGIVKLQNTLMKIIVIPKINVVGTKECRHFLLCFPNTVLDVSCCCLYSARAVRMSLGFSCSKTRIGHIWLLLSCFKKLITCRRRGLFFFFTSSLFRSRKLRLTAVGVRWADHVTPSIHKSWH
jgi:hypothetical protein